MTDTILVVEDEPDILGLVSYNLKQAGFQVEEAEDGEVALQLIEDRPVDLVVLDLMLPGIDGLEVCRLLKQNVEHKDLPILMLTARTEEVDRIVGLELGAEDYLVKPFSPRELILRIKAILRRVKGGKGESEEEAAERIQAGGLTIDLVGHRVLLEGEAIELTATEFRLLLTLAQRRGRVQSREELLNVVWGYEYSGYRRTVDTHIRRLREKLGDAYDLVETVRGVGYRFRRESS
ncbi:MAG: response regulator transcription factor [Gemmatimonadetes bacterium]|jgi:two-component system, OmpR family, phosphate regulon response regulator PhoB|nr:response regulator transcription factor [Gemmatimonadota bacterium]